MTRETAVHKIEKFFSGYPDLKYVRGQLLVRAEEEPRGIYFLKSGQVRQYLIAQSGEDITLNVFKPGAFFPMSWAVTGNNNLYYYEAVIPSTVVLAPKNRVVGLVKKNPDILYDLLRRVYRGTEGLLQRLAYLMAGNAESQILENLLINAKRFGNRKSNRRIHLKVSEKDLATQTGLTRETVSRELGRLHELGLINYQRNNLIINDLSLLETKLAEYL